MRLRNDRRRRTLPSFVHEVGPGAFAFVMATGIISTALYANEAAVVSIIFLIIAITGYLALLVAIGTRIAVWPQSMRWYLFSPKGFSYLTFVAGTNVLATRLAVAGHLAVALVLLAVGTVSWLVLGYGVPLALITGRHHDRGLRFITGMWFLWVVAVQSVAVAASTLAPRVDFGGLPVLASVCWAIGLVLYPFMATLWLARMLLISITPEQLRPAYWVFMGACAITVLGGATLLRTPAQTVLPHSVILGMAFVQWSFCTWLLPLLLGLGVWRHVIRRYPLGYDAGMWGMVFPIGMYGVASHILGNVIGASWMADLGRIESWLAVAVWLAVFVAMLIRARQALYRS